MARGAAEQVIADAFREFFPDGWLDLALMSTQAPRFRLFRNRLRNLAESGRVVTLRQQGGSRRIGAGVPRDRGLHALRMTTAIPSEPAGTMQDLAFGEAEAVLQANGVRSSHARTLWRAMHRQLVESWDEVADVPPAVRQWLATQPLAFPGQSAEVASADGWTRKFLLRLADGREIETVLMGFPGRYTACLSTQAGCAMGCVFCATGQGGFFRHLRPGEIVAQVRHARRALRATGAEGPRNLVLMGMGEPLHNYDAVMTALDIITDTRAFNIGPARISISTVGVVPGILRLAEERRPYNLAVSLHGADDDERSALVPVNRRWPLADLMAACRHYGRLTGRRIFFEWTLVAGKNDTPETAHRLAGVLRGLDAHVNLIPLNPTQGFGGTATHPAAVLAFKQVIQAAGFPCTVRQRRGIDVAAGCGQLQSEVRRSVSSKPHSA